MKPRYSGNNGFYSSVDPNPESIQRLSEWFTRLYPHKLVPLNYEQDIGIHCTIMYSHSALSCTPAFAHHLVSMVEGLPFVANVESFDYWKGHDDDGYFVAKLSCPELQRRHTMWKHVGAIPTFQDYQAHITLATGDASTYWKSQLNALNKALAASPLTLVLTDEKINDLDSD